MEDSRQSYVVALVVVIVVALLALSRFPRFVGSSNTVVSVPSSQTLRGGDLSRLRGEVASLNLRLKKMDKKLIGLRKDHEALSAWTLQSLLAVQAGDAPLAPREVTVADIEPQDQVEAVSTQGGEFLGNGEQARKIVEHLELFPQQVDYVEAALFDYFRRSRSADRSGDSADVRRSLFTDLHRRLENLLTREQLERFDEMVQSSSPESP